MVFCDQKDINWIKGIKNLQKLIFGGNLQNGNVDFLLNMPNLQLILCNNKRNYSLKRKDFEKVSIAKGYDIAKLTNERLRFEML